jgi:hypothetical protein
LYTIGKVPAIDRDSAPKRKVSIFQNRIVPIMSKCIKYLLATLELLIVLKSADEFGGRCYFGRAYRKIQNMRLS